MTAKGTPSAQDGFAAYCQHYDENQRKLQAAVRAECDQLAGEPGFCFFPRCDCQKVPVRVRVRVALTKGETDDRE